MSNVSHVTTAVLACGWTIVACAAAAQELPTPLYAQHVSQLPTARVEFAVLADSTFGVGLFSAPSVRTIQRDSIHLVTIWFDPDSLQHWLETAPAYVTKSATTGYPLPSILWTPSLRSPEGTAELWVGRKTGERMPGWEHYVAIGTPQIRWQAQVTADELAALLMLLYKASTQAHRNPTVTSTRKDGTHLFLDDGVHCVGDTVFEPAKLLHASVNHPSPGGSGQVYSQYIVGTDGKAEPGSFRALIATNDKYATEAQRAVAAADFKPAHYCGTPVRQGVQQRFVFASAGP